LYLYWILPRDRRPPRDIARGALFGSIGLAALQYFAGALNGVFLHNSAAAIFGPIIVLMLSLNIFATLVMLGAAWTATAGQVEPLAIDGGEPEATMLPLAENPYVTGQVLVPQRVAKRGVTFGIVAGYALGGAAGVGLGAVLGRLAGAVAHRRRR
ncbi:MAG TPA: YhjD/YihY/BrkB family envelope integrity protein, partial [Propionibacteriaceae bacterium]